MPAIRLDMLSHHYPLAFEATLLSLAESQAFRMLLFPTALALAIFWVIIVKLLAQSQGKAVFRFLYAALCTLVLSVLTYVIILLDVSHGVVQLRHSITGNSSSVAPYLHYVPYLAAALGAAWFSRHVKTLCKVIANQRATIAAQMAKLTTLEVSLQTSRTTEGTLRSDVTRLAHKADTLKHHVDALESQVSTLETADAAKAECIVGLEVTVEQAEAHPEATELAICQRDATTRKQASASRAEIDGLKTTLYAARSSAADREADLTQTKAALKSTQKVLGVARDELVNTRKNANAQIHELKDQVQHEKVRGCAKDAARKACEKTFTSVIADKDALMGELKTSHAEAVLAGQAQTKTIVKHALSIKSLEEKLAASRNTEAAQRQTIISQREGLSTKDAVISAQEEYLNAKDVTIAAQQQAHIAAIDARDAQIAKLLAALAAANEALAQRQSPQSSDSQSATAADAPQPTASLPTTTTPPAPHSLLLEEETTLDAVVVEDAPLPTQAAELKQQNSDTEEKQAQVLATLEASASAILRSGMSLVSESLQEIALSTSSEMLFNVELDMIPAADSFFALAPAAIAADYDDDDVQEEAEVPRALPTPAEAVTAVLAASMSAILRSGQFLASESLAIVALSTSSEMLFNVDFDTLVDSASFELPPSESTTTAADNVRIQPESEVAPAPASPSHIVASITADLLMNLVLDLPPATPSTPDRRSSGLPVVVVANAESPLGPNMVASSSSQLLLREASLELPPLSPY
ncbi:hypothetical protein L226DRAFT_576722 [Lentinus tigrinus ALCF2SS1-7]|uniref:Uncharacterized protein n=1 Tax=Lentinus tigrinus ALCF2SS1-6 TaxID=1328759 RepID=A0A5C2SBM1_9APHY|nr:hypothetical protein L227DRAFT_611193 [Lentinus tigrinus ALCF2SS1-6]RPD68064.1 hypothetical protein L226DRAFT_576722 [Lentinus tigrinus ALCF2SS1-7]